MSPFPVSNPTTLGDWLPAVGATIGAILRRETLPNDPEDELPAVTHWAAPVAAGAEDGSSINDPFLISDFFALPPSPGDHLGLKDGTYSGADSLIRPATTIAGTPNNYIYISALNDGAAIIDGGGEIPVLILSDWWWLQGFNAKNGKGAIFAIGNAANPCDHVVGKRLIGWDASPTVGSIFNITNSTNCLVEDSAGFGIGRTIFGIAQFGSDSTYRRCWGMLNSFDEAQPKGTQIGYQCYRSTCENVIMTWDWETAAVSDQRGLLCFGRIDKPPGFDPNSDSAHLGCIAYLLAEQERSNLSQLADAFQQTSASPSHGGNTFKDVVFLTEQTTSSGRMVRLQNMDPECFYTNITEIGDPGGTSSIGTGWTVTNRVQAGSVGAAPSPWAAPGSGARVLYRYVDRVLTDDLLWPWPMDARIRAALTASGRDPDTIFRGTGNGVTELMEDIFGAIPGI